LRFQFVLAEVSVGLFDGISTVFDGSAQRHGHTSASAVCAGYRA